MIRIFFDTEFTGLTIDPKLISIGLVDESGEHFALLNYGGTSGRSGWPGTVASGPADATGADIATGNYAVRRVDAGW